jgi:hypothetical protein
MIPQDCFHCIHGDGDNLKTHCRVADGVYGSLECRKHWRITTTQDFEAIEIIGGRKRLKYILETGSSPTQQQFDALYELYFDDMPYGTKKARTGDPEHFIWDKLKELL